MRQRRKALLKGVAIVKSAWSIGATLAVAQEQSTWQQIQSTGKLRMGALQAPPWWSKNPSTGQWDSGVAVTLGQNMAEVLGVELETVEVTWGTAVAALQSNKIDFMPILDAKPERANGMRTS